MPAFCSISLTHDHTDTGILVHLKSVLDDSISRLKFMCWLTHCQRISRTTEDSVLLHQRKRKGPCSLYALQCGQETFDFPLCRLKTKPERECSYLTVAASSKFRQESSKRFFSDKNRVNGSYLSLLQCCPSQTHLQQALSVFQGNRSSKSARLDWGNMLYIIMLLLHTSVQFAS